AFQRSSRRARAGSTQRLAKPSRAGAGAAAVRNFRPLRGIESAGICEEATMRRILQVLVLSTAIGASVAGTAFAASSPAASTGGTTNVGDSTATLNGTVNPNGRVTQYDFSFGPTTAYGSTTAVHTVKAGTKAVAVSIRLTGLTPGTPYHYRINAVSSGGAVLGAVRNSATT